MVPCTGLIRPAIILPNVVLPEPFGPMIQLMDPSLNSRLSILSSNPLFPRNLNMIPEILKDSFKLLLHSSYFHGFFLIKVIHANVHYEFHVRRYCQIQAF